MGYFESLWFVFMIMYVKQKSIIYRVHSHQHSHLMYKCLHASHLQNIYSPNNSILFNALVSNDIKGPQMKLTINDCILIEEKSPVLPAKNRIKNYELDDTLFENLELFDGMTTTFTEPMGCSQQLDEIFSDALQDSEFPTSFQVNTKSALKETVDNAYQMADYVGQEGIKKLELMLNEFKSCFNKKDAGN